MKSTGLITLDTLQVGDRIQCEGDKSIAGFGGIITKLNRVTLVLTTEYMGHPIVLKTRRSYLRGELRAIRDGKLLSSLYVA